MFQNYNQKVWKMLLLLVVAGSIFSCRSHKDLTMLRDVSAQESLKGSPRQPAPYRIRHDDNLYVNVISSNKEMNELFNPAFAGGNASLRNVSYNDPNGQYVNGYQVTGEGSVVLPLIGKIHVAGMTLVECEAAIQKKAGEYLKELTVRVRLLNYKVTVMGEVANPGVYYNYNYDFTIMDAISFANGVTDYANLEKVLVLRAMPEGSQTYYLDLSSKEALSSPGYYLLPNDVVMVQPARYKNVKLRTPVYTVVLAAATTILLFVNIFK